MLRRFLTARTGAPFSGTAAKPRWRHKPFSQLPVPWKWAPAPRKVSIDGRTVRLDGYHRQPPNTLGVADGYGNKIVLLVVPAHTEPDRAHTIVMAAAAADDATNVDTLLSR